MPDKQWLRAGIASRAEGVDRAASVLRGYVVAQEGPFKSQGRGEFDMGGLKQIVELGNSARGGLKSRLGHPTMSEDGIGKFLGRGKDFRIARARDDRTGKEVAAVRGDLHFDKTAHDTPHGDLAKYVMDLAESDPAALSSSLVLQVEEEWRVDKRGVPLEQDGETLPPLWMPTKLHASDIVDTGDAVDGLLSAEEMTKALSVGLTPELQKALRFDNVARLASQMLDGLFAGKEREEVEARCRNWLGRYLAFRFGEVEPIEPVPTPILDGLKLRLERMDLTTREAKR